MDFKVGDKVKIDRVETPDELREIGLTGECENYVGHEGVISHILVDSIGYLITIKGLDGLEYGSIFHKNCVSKIENIPAKKEPTGSEKINELETRISVLEKSFKKIKGAINEV